jgi:hypothetical protein
MLYFAKKSDILKLDQIEEDFLLHTIEGEQLGSPGDYLATDLNNNKSIVTKEEYDDMVRVEYWRTENYRSMYEQNAESMSELSQTEDDSFIVNNTYEQIQERLSK